MLFIALFVHNIFFWMIILINPEMDIIDYQFTLTSRASLASNFKSISLNCTYVAQCQNKTE